MDTEYEVRVLEIDVLEVEKKLKELGADFSWDRLQKRYVYDFIPKIDGKWIRLRTNGDKTTLTIKNVVSSTIDGTQELEIVVDDFEKTNLLLNELGFVAKGYQENRRRQYILDGVEIDIDSWPLIPTYLEIEGKSEQEVYQVLEKLGISRDSSTSRDVEGIYFDYGYNLEEIYDLKLEEDSDMNNKYEFFIAGRTRNKENILKICALFDKYKISYYCFLKDEDDWGYGNKNQTPEEKQKEFESLSLKSDIVLNLFHNDLEGEKNSKNLLLVLPAGKAAHIESGIAYGLGKKCYAIGKYEATDTLYNIFEEIFSNEIELEEFLKKTTTINNH